MLGTALSSLQKLTYTKKTKLMGTETDWRLSQLGWGVGKERAIAVKGVQVSRYKISKSWGCSVQHSVYS